MIVPLIQSFQILKTILQDASNIQLHNQAVLYGEDWIGIAHNHGQIFIEYFSVPTRELPPL